LPQRPKRQGVLRWGKPLSMSPLGAYADWRALSRRTTTGPTLQRIAPVNRPEGQGEDYLIHEVSTAPRRWGTRRPTTAKTAIGPALRLAHQDADEPGAWRPGSRPPRMRPRLCTRLLGPAGAGGPHSRRFTATMKIAPRFLAFGPIACSYAESSRSGFSSPRHTSSQRRKYPE